MDATRIEALTRAAATAPRDASRWLRLGTSLHSVGRSDEAATALLRAVKLRPNWADASSAYRSMWREWCARP